MRAIKLGLMFAGIVLASSAATAAEPADAPAAAADATEELDEVIVEARQYRPRRTFRKLQEPLDWMARLVGEFTIAGTVSVTTPEGGETTSAAAGRADCVGFGIGPGVQCEVQVRWPRIDGTDGAAMRNGMSLLDPALVLYGFEPVLPGVAYIIVDREGVASTGVGSMASRDTMFSRTRCTGVAGKCERTIRVTAADKETVTMRLAFATEGSNVVGYQLVLTRVPGTEAIVYGRKQRR